MISWASNDEIILELILQLLTHYMCKLLSINLIYSI